MNDAERANPCAPRLSVLMATLLLTCAASVLSNESALAAEVGDTGTASGAPGTARPGEGVDLTELSLDELLNVQVTTASRLEERQSDAPGIVSVVTKDELRRFGGTTLKDILERVPGLIGSTVYMTDRSMIAIRGDQISNSGEHVLLLINGRPVREVQEGGIKSEMLETFTDRQSRPHAAIVFGKETCVNVHRIESRRRRAERPLGPPPPRRQRPIARG